MLSYKDIAKSARNLLKRALISFCYLTVFSKWPKKYVFTFLIERFHNQIKIFIKKSSTLLVFYSSNFGNNWQFIKSSKSAFNFSAEIEKVFQAFYKTTTTKKTFPRSIIFSSLSRYTIDSFIIFPQIYTEKIAGAYFPSGVRRCLLNLKALKYIKGVKKSLLAFLAKSCNYHYPVLSEFSSGKDSNNFNIQ